MPVFPICAGHDGSGVVQEVGPAPLPSGPWLAGELTVACLQEVLPETAPLEIRRYQLANLRAFDLVVVGRLGEEVASSGRHDAQAESPAEHLRAKLVDIPVSLVPGGES
jgi:hypothetical protein